MADTMILRLATLVNLIGLMVSRQSTRLTTDARVLNDANLSSMTIIGENEDLNAYFLNAGSNTCSIKSKHGQLEFSINKIPFLSANHGSMETSSKTEFFEGVSFKNPVEINKKRQWALAYRMDYRDFNPAIVYECGIYKLIGGYMKTSRDEMIKTFPLPLHKMIKIEGHYHFIDNWKGETAYIKVLQVKQVLINGKDQQVVWTESADIRGITNGLDTCGGATIDPIIGRKFEVTMLHDEPNLSILFGSTLTCDPGYASYGISDLEIYVL